MSFEEICEKEIVNTFDVSSLGFAGDVVFDSESRKITALIIKGRAKFFGIFGREETTGETVVIKQLSKERKTADYLAKILNKNKVSVHHAKDVLRDFLIEPVLK